jgi:hypothetical protein
MSERFVKVPSELLARKGLSSTAKLVFAAITDRFGKNGQSWPGLRKISKDVGMSKPAVKRAIDELDKCGLLIVERGAGPHGSNLYSLPTGHDPLPEGGNESLLVTKRTRSRIVTSGGNESLPQVVTNRVHNQTNEPDQLTRPNIHPPKKAVCNSKAKSNTKPRKPDAIWDTLTELFNIQNPTRSECSRLGRVVADLKAKNATPEDIRNVYKRCQTEWDGRAFNLEALVKWFEQFRGQPAINRNPGRVDAPTGKYDGLAIVTAGAGAANGTGS